MMALAMAKYTLGFLLSRFSVVTDLMCFIMLFVPLPESVCLPICVFQDKFSLRDNNVEVKVEMVVNIHRWMLCVYICIFLHVIL